MAGAVGQGAGPPGPPRALGTDMGLSIVESMVHTLAQGVQRDWLRVTSDVIQEARGIVPTVWFRGRPPDLSQQKFDRLWPNRLVEQGEWFVQRGRQVVVKLSPDWPCQFGNLPPV